jgi:glucose/arabinose dehydrogenase
LTTITTSGRQDADLKEEGMNRFARFAAWLLVMRAVTTWAQVVSLEPLVGGLDQPVFLTHAHDGSNRKFIVEQPGRILVMQPGSTSTSVFLDIRSRVLSGGERGLLGLAFHPLYATNGRFFVNYTRETDGATVIAEYHVSAVNRNAADPGSESVLLVILQPYPNHNGGMIAFGPDNYLYIGMGDGGSAYDPENRAQNVDDLLGKMLRIDVDHPLSPSVRYSSPASNPHFGPSVPGRDEIYAIGLRNPWRFSFDRLNGQLYAGDVGQVSREEIDIIVRGGNYGWRVLEGTLCTGLGPAPCSMPSIAPITEYATGQGGRCAITGGYVYRGSRQSLPYGAYIYGDYCSGEIFMFQGGPANVILDTNLNISSFGEDESGEIYVVGLGGSISRLAGTAAPGASQKRYATANRGGVSLVSSGAGISSLRTGYARIIPDAGDALPDGLALLSWHQNALLVGETTIASSPLVGSGRTFALVSASRNTGVAIANPNPFPVNVDFHFTNSIGFDFGHNSTTIPANGQVSAFLNQSPFNGGSEIDGTFTFRAVGGLVSATAVLGVTNARSEFLMSALPVVPINSTVLNGTIFPQWTHGGVWQSEFIVVNPSDVLVTGLINLFSANGTFVEGLVYAVAPRSSQHLSPLTQNSTTITGFARVIPTGGPLPSAVELMRVQTSAGIVTESSLTAIAASGLAFRGYGEFSTVARTGIAIVNLFGDDATATVELRDLDGSFRDRADVDLPPSGQVSLYIDEIPGIDASTPFQGIVRVTSATQIAVTLVRVRLNERGDYLINVTPPKDAAETTLGQEAVFPQLAVGGGSDMQFVLINPQNTGSNSGLMRFFAPNGDVLQLPLP